MHSVVDILGLNPIARAVFDNAAAAVVGHGAGRRAARCGTSARGPSGITMLGHTTPAVMRIRAALEQAGHEPVDLPRERCRRAGDGEARRGGRARRRDRLHALGARELPPGRAARDRPGSAARRRARRGIPQVVVPGCVDFFNQGAPRHRSRASTAARQSYYHNPVATLVRLEPDEMAELGRIVAERLNEARGPVRVLAPTRGFSLADVEGGDLWYPGGRRRLPGCARNARFGPRSRSSSSTRTSTTRRSPTSSPSATSPCPRRRVRDLMGR